MGTFSNKFLSKRVCVDTHNHCTFKEPYSELQFLNKNPATGRDFTQEEIDEKNKQYENMCKLSNSSVSRCCDLNNKLYDTVNEKLVDSHGRGTSCLPQKLALCTVQTSLFVYDQTKCQGTTSTTLQ